jgi:hypothetical protein
MELNEMDHFTAMVDSLMSGADTKAELTNEAYRITETFNQ